MKLTAIAIALLSIASPRRGLGCAMAFPEHKVGNAFVVEVSYSGHPLPETKVEISRETDKEPYLVDTKSTKLNERGQTVIHGLVPGRYFLVVKHAEIDGEAIELNVAADEQAADAEDKLNLGWPNKKVFKVRRLSGVLFRTPFDPSKHSAEPPLGGAELTLADARTGTQHSGVVKDDGSFAFPGLAAGLYILHINQAELAREPAGDKEGIDGNVFVEVLPDARDEALPLLRLYMSDCGMGMRGKDGTEIF